jgi:hypothetical protein
VDAPGDPTTVVVVAEEIAVLVRPGVNAVVVVSAQDACTSRSAVLVVTIRTMSLVLVRFI